MPSRHYGFNAIQWLLPVRLLSFHPPNRFHYSIYRQEIGHQKGMTDPCLRTGNLVAHEVYGLADARRVER